MEKIIKLATSDTLQTSPSMDQGLVVDSVEKKYRKKTVLRGVSMQIRKGEVVGLLGPNGAGKTTSFYTMVGLVKPDSGRILLDAHDITHMPMYRRARLGIGYLPQEASIFRGMTVEENIWSVLEICEQNPTNRSEKLENLLDEFSIQHIRQAQALALSGGERRRVEIARALASGPSYMLLDEPFAGIDPIAISDIRNLVSHLKDRDIG
ncbi:MAG: LPS export ABC transporter ATP-binding protein, partial [Kordiimonadaceae bacterium]|nr:LPS export ABC transporter ATP-binding protein [Kordiimonadaceae bacterium]